MKRAWEAIGKQLPGCLGLTAKQWTAKLSECMKPAPPSNRPFVSTKEVYTLRKDLKGLVCGQVDKNLHELWFCCPCLYYKAWNNMYGEQTGYAIRWAPRAARGARCSCRRAWRRAS